MNKYYINLFERRLRSEIDEVNKQYELNMIVRLINENNSTKFQIPLDIGYLKDIYNHNVIKLNYLPVSEELDVYKARTKLLEMGCNKDNILACIMINVNDLNGQIKLKDFVQIHNFPSRIFNYNDDIISCMLVSDLYHSLILLALSKVEL